MSNYNPRSDPQHLSNLEFSDITYLSGQLVTNPEEKGVYYRTVLSLDSVIYMGETNPVSGRILLYLKNEVDKPLEYGDRIYIECSVQQIPKTNNPFVFDYRGFLERKKIYAQSFVDPSKYFLIKNDRFSIVSEAMAFREEGTNRLKKIIGDEGARSILRALVFGDKSELDSELKSAYSGVGVIHVLAVSGLHVGIVYWLFNLLVSMTLRFPGGKWIGGFLIVGGLWFYAFITGLSPSVMRASTMFSIIAIQNTIGREGNIYNSLGLSAFLLLLINPYLLYDLGFQLSYLAVFGIVYLQPRIYGLLICGNWIIDKIWSLIAVSLAAQIATVPLTLFYFHTFPTYFLLANLVVIPVISIILISSFPMLLTHSISSGAGLILGWGIENTLKLLNHFILWINELPFRSIEPVSLTPLQVLLIYIFLISFFIAHQYKSFMVVTFCLLTLCTFMIVTIHRNVEHSIQELIVVYQSRDGLFIDFVDGNEAFLVSTSNSKELTEIEYQINPFRLQSGLPTIESVEDVHFFTDSTWKMDVHWKGNHFNIVRSLPQTEEMRLDNCEILFLGSDVDFNQMDSFDHHFRFLVVEDEMTSPDEVRLRDSLVHEGILVHSVSLDGFWKLPLNKLK